MRKGLLTGLSLAAIAGVAVAFGSLSSGGDGGGSLRVAPSGSPRSAALATEEGGPGAATMMAAAAAATVSVDAASNGGALLQSFGKYNNLHGRDTIDRVGTGDAARIAELSTVTMRGFIGAPGFYNFDTQSYTFGNYTTYLSRLSAMSQQIMLSLTSVKYIEDERDRDPARYTALFNQWKVISKAALKYYKQNYSKIRFIEALNEPDCGGGDAVLTPTEYFVYYRAVAQMVREVNAELNPSTPLEVGGPALCGFNDSTLITFLNNVDSTGETFNFLTYHQYKYRTNPLQVQYEYPKVKQWFQQRGINTDTPVFVSEAGIFPGPTSTANGIVADRLMQAAGLATMTRYYLNSGNQRVMQWVVHHNQNARKDQMSPSDGVPYPYYNMQRMLTWLYGTTRLTTTFSPIASTGQGVQGIATKGSSGVTLMFWNYQPENLAASYDVSVTINNLASTVLAGRNIRVERYLIDQTHSNYDHDPGAATLDKIVDAVVSPRSSYSSVTNLKANGLSFIRLTPTNSPPTT